MKVTYNHEYERRLRAAVIGCGGHAFRNVFPTFQYAPVELAAVCDINKDLAAGVGRQFGAQAVYTDYREMFERENLDAVFAITNYDENGKPRYPKIAIDAMEAGVNAWIEKPPAATREEIEAMMAASKKTGKITSVGFKKMFFPANVKAKEIISESTFGELSTITARYPQHMPPFEERSDRHKMKSFLDHVCHPHSLLLYLAGKLETLYVERHKNGASVVALRFENGCVGALHYAHGRGGTSFLERTEIIGEGQSVIVDNNIRVTHYGPGYISGGYGRAGSYYDNEGGPVATTWEPEWSLGQLYNKAVFLLGYAPEIQHFCDCVLKNRAPERGNLEDAMHLMRIYEAYCQKDGQVVKIGD